MPELREEGKGGAGASIGGCFLGRRSRLPSAHQHGIARRDARQGTEVRGLNDAATILYEIYMLRFAAQRLLEHHQQANWRDQKDAWVYLEARASATTDDVRANATFCVDNLAQLTMQPEQIPILRRTILSLAVQGSVVTENSVRSEITGVPISREIMWLPR